VLYVRFNDGDSTAWVQAVANPAADIAMLTKALQNALERITALEAKIDGL
jgi:hypothetical protein